MVGATLLMLFFYWQLALKRLIRCDVTLHRNCDVTLHRNITLL